MHDFSNAPTSQMGDFELIPDGTLAWAILVIRPKSPTGETPSKSSDGAYLDCELTITEGPFIRRKVFTKIGTRGSEAYVNQGRAAIRAILEVGRNANVTANPNAYKINSYMDLSGLKVAVKIKVEKGTQGYSDKNDVAAWLTPNPESSAHKGWVALTEGQSSIAPSVGSVGQASTTLPWAGESKAAAPAPATNKPAWL